MNRRARRAGARRRDRASVVCTGPLLPLRVVGPDVVAHRRGPIVAMDPRIIWGGVGALVLLIILGIGCRIWKRNRYYKKVQHSLDEEERAFQETLARSYQDDAQLDGGDREKLRMLDTYMSTVGTAGAVGATAATEDLDVGSARAEDVDRFMAELAAAAAGGSALPPDSAEKPLEPAADEK